MKINKRLLFTSVELLNYLKTVKKFSKIDEEILATITYKYAYRKLNNYDVLISFPYKESLEIELNTRSLLKLDEIGGFIKKYTDENSPMDSIFVNPIDQKRSNIRPIQVKFLGKGKWKDVTTKKFIEFLKEKSLYENSEITLLISIQNSFKINLKEIANWLNQNRFPFREVVLIRSNNFDGNMEFYQLKPTRNSNPNKLIINREEMLKEF